MTISRCARATALSLIIALLASTAAKAAAPAEPAEPAKHSAAKPFNRAYYERRGDIVWDVPASEKVIALTFDDGPDKNDTPMILDLLKEYHAKATFFVMGSKVRKYPDIVLRTAMENHELANHTYTHKALSYSCTEEQIRREIFDTQEAIASVTGVRARLFRPPGGLFNPQVVNATKNAGLQMVLWSWHQDTHDWSRPGVGRIVRGVLGRVRNGDIVLLHDYVDGPTQTVDALKQILPTLSEQGYKFVTVSELLNYRKQ